MIIKCVDGPEIVSVYVNLDDVSYVSLDRWYTTLRLGGFYYYIRVLFKNGQERTMSYIPSPKLMSDCAGDLAKTEYNKLITNLEGIA